MASPTTSYASSSSPNACAATPIKKQASLHSHASTSSADGSADAFAGTPFKQVNFRETWNINKMAFRNIRKIESDMFISSEENIQYSFIMNPKHRNDKEKMHFYMFIEVPRGKYVDVDFTLACGNYTKRFNYLYKQSTLRGSNVFAYKKYQEKYIHNGWMELKIVGTFKICDAPPLPSTSPAVRAAVAATTESPSTSLPSVEHDSAVVKFTQKHDFILIAEEKQLLAHKAILRQHMTLFDTVFNPESCEHKINDLSFDVGQAAIGFCYGQQLPAFEIEKLTELFKFCQVSGMNELQGIVQTEMTSKIDASNAVLLANISMKIHAAELNEQCLQFLGNNSMSKDIDFKNLDQSLKIELFDRSHS